CPEHPPGPSNSFEFDCPTRTTKINPDNYSETSPYQQSVVPGLLQTEGYAAAMIRAFSPGESVDKVRRMVEARMLRQDTLENEDAQFLFILDEAVLRRRVGGPAVMRAQLLRLAELASARIRIMIFPFGVGAHAALAGPITLFEFTEDVPPFVYLENARGSATISTASELAATYLELFLDLEEKSVKDHVPEILRRIADAMGTEPAEFTLPD
ncbi:DUF5753 domain-containing protein, partial [Streptomyces sp. PA03-6a]|nr:DUF5753 domain-containing protein [Streptomyces sp. PA03-6a]